MMETGKRYTGSNPMIQEAKSKKRNFLKPGDRVLMKDGSILTVKYLEFTEFVSEERNEYIKKKDISELLI